MDLHLFVHNSLDFLQAAWRRSHIGYPVCLIWTFAFWLFFPWLDLLNLKFLLVVTFFSITFGLTVTSSSSSSSTFSLLLQKLSFNPFPLLVAQLNPGSPIETPRTQAGRFMIVLMLHGLLPVVVLIHLVDLRPPPPLLLLQLLLLLRDPALLLPRSPPSRNNDKHLEHFLKRIHLQEQYIPIWDETSPERPCRRRHIREQALPTAWTSILCRWTTWHVRLVTICLCRN